MAFGTRGSVSAFARVVRALQKILQTLFGVVVTVCVDDFAIVEPSEIVESSVATVQAVFKFLGRVEQPTDKKPSTKCEALGIVLDLEAAHQCEVRIANKPSRVAAISRDIAQALERGKMKQEHEALKA